MLLCGFPPKSIMYLKKKLSNLLTSVETRDHIESQLPGTDLHIFM